MSKLDFAGQKVMLCGIQGSGKTHKSRELVQNKKVLVYSPHEHDWNKMPNNVIFYEGTAYNKDELERFLQIAKKLIEKKQIDGVLIDEFDMYLRSNYDLTPTMNDLILNHRHWGRKQGKKEGCFLIAITRRPQDVPTKMFESSKYIIAFALEGANAQKKFNDIYKGWGEMIANLSKDRFEYTIKEIGKPPIKIEPLGKAQKVAQEPKIEEIEPKQEESLQEQEKEQE